VNVLESIRDLASVQVVALAVTLIILLALGIFILVRIRRNPKDKEQRRRLAVNQSGRLGDATITEVHDSTIFYEYSVRGVLYTASQDIAKLREHIPIEPDRLIGPATLKYSPQNPANSIILCEEWSGLRIGSPAKSGDVSRF
jgi:hypothetical protein